VWLKWPISFYSGKDLCTEAEFQLLLYSTNAALPTLPIQGFAESLQHCIRPQSSVTSSYGSFSALNIPYKEVIEF